MPKPPSGSKMRRLDLGDLAHGMPAITPSLGQSMVEAAGVSLEDQGHGSGVRFLVQMNQDTHDYVLAWTPTTDRARMCHGDPQDAVEHGACGIGLLLIRQHVGLYAVERSQKGTGIDYWLGEDDGLFQRMARLEVSGIKKGIASSIRRRVKKKIEQTKRSDSTGLPAYIVVVEFGTPTGTVVMP